MEGKVHFWELDTNAIMKLKDEFWDRVNETLSVHNVSMQKVHGYLYQFLKNKTISPSDLIKTIDKLRPLDIVEEIL